MAQDEFEQLLERCSERLSGITLSVPALEGGSTRRTPVYSLSPAPPPPVPAAPPEPAPEAPQPAPPAAARREPEAPPAPQPRPAAIALPPLTSAPTRDEDEVFPPSRVGGRTPPPSVPLWRARPAPTPVPRPETSRRLPAVAAAAALAAAGTFGLWLARRPAADLVIEVGDADAIAVRAEKGDLLVAEGKELVDLSHDGLTLERRPLDSPIDSLCWNQGSLWSADGRTAAVVERGEGGRTTVFRLNHVPGAIYVNGRYLWTSEKDGHALHQFLISRSILGAMLQPIDSFDLNELSPEGFTLDDDGILWLADGPTRRLFRLRLENGSFKRLSSAPLSPFVGPQGKLQDLTIERDAVWILTKPAESRNAVLRRLSLSRLDWTAAS
jgi:hypothetical protein